MNQDYSDDMIRLADEAVATARQLNIELDYSESSIEKLEWILELFHRQIPDASPTPEQIENMALGWGAYFGECIRRNLGGEWEFFDGSDAVKLGAEYVFVTSKAFRRILDGSEESVAALYSSLKRH